MRALLLSTVLVISLLSSSINSVSAGIAEGKHNFFNKKGTYGPCAHCHPSGGSAGRWDQKNKVISKTKGSKIADLKNIGSRKSYPQIRRIAGIYAKKYGIPLSQAELDDVAKWLFMANK